MAASKVSPALQQYVDDEMLRAPLLFDQIVDGAVDHARKGLPTMSPSQRTAVGDLMQALQVHRLRLGEYFLRSLQEQVADHMSRRSPKSSERVAPKGQRLALVDEEEVAADVELSHCIEAIKSVAEFELRELLTFTSALVGDMDVASDHNPFRAEVYARALWAASQALPLSRGHQVAFMRYASTPLAEVLRKTYAAATSRLEAMGVEPAAYRTLILPAGSRRGSRSSETTFSPDLYQMRDTMPAPLDVPLTYQGQLAGSRGGSAPAPVPRPAGMSMDPVLPGQGGGAPARREHWSEVARAAPHRADRQAIELVSRLFDAMLTDERVPQDVSLLISRLHGPAMRLALRDSSLLDKGEHPLWRFINRLCFSAEMAPDAADPERVQLLRLAQTTIDQLAAEPEQNTGLYRWANERLEAYLTKRLTRRLTAVATHVGVLQKLEDRLSAGHTEPSTLHGMLDLPQLDTVPADLLNDHVAPRPSRQGEEWLERLKPGDWVRMFIQGRWVQAQVLWPGERREVWLFGDGASDTTWAVRRGALLMMHGRSLLKSLRQRSIVASAAARVQEQVSQETSA